MQLSVNTFVSLDGVMQGPGARDEDTTGGFDRGGWLVPFVDEDFGRIVDGWFRPADALLLGRTTYQMMQPYWEDFPQSDDRVATALNTLPKHVVSATLTEETATWQGTRLVTGDVVEQIRRLKAGAGRELQVHGSWQLARTLHDAGLVDLYRLLVFPTVVGAGKRLFADGATPAGFEVAAHEVTSRGVVALTLRPTPFRTADLEMPEDQA